MRSTIVALASAAGLWASGARAQEGPQEATRRTLLDAAFSIATSGDHDNALRLGEQAARVRMTPSLRLFLAEEHEHLSRDAGGAWHLTEAAEQADLCVREATEQAAVNNRQRLLHDCAALAARVASRVGAVHVVVSSQPDDDTRVTLNGRDLDRRRWNVTVPYALGALTLEARRGGSAPFHHATRVEAGLTREVRVSLPAMAVAAPPATPRPAAAVARSEGSPALRVAGWAAVALGAAAGAFGAVHWWRSSAQSADARDGAGVTGEAWARYANALRVESGAGLTVDDVCARAARDGATLRDALAAQTLCDANREAVTAAWAAGLGGVALAAAGVTMALVGRAPSRVTAAPMMGAGLRGASLGVRF
jgi:hypothetical protein